jgi:translation initiation factor RLI1
MAKKMALVDFNKCRPEECGVCPAAEACSYKLLKQEVSAEAPMTDPSLCRGCADCVRACPHKAIQVVSM